MPRAGDVERNLERLLQYVTKRLTQSPNDLLVVPPFPLLGSEFGDYGGWGDSLVRQWRALQALEGALPRGRVLLAVQSHAMWSHVDDDDPIPLFQSGQERWDGSIHYLLYQDGQLVARGGEGAGVASPIILTHEGIHYFVGREADASRIAQYAASYCPVDTVKSFEAVLFGFNAHDGQQRTRILSGALARGMLIGSDFRFEAIHYVSAVGFYGGRMLVPFKGRWTSTELQSQEHSASLVGKGYSPSIEANAGQLYRALVDGIRVFFNTQGLTKALVGLSGGLDSSLVLTLTVHALGAENCLALFLPTTYTSSISREDSVQLARNLGVELLEIPIDTLRLQAEGLLQKAIPDVKPGLAEENLQARLRAVILMGVSNKLGHVLLNTSNRSELSVGYSTLYGDSCGALCVLADLWKTEVYGVARYINAQGEELIPERIITRPPSAELRHDQKDSDSLPSYDVLDAILGALLSGGSEKELAKIYGKEVVERIASLFRNSSFKRQVMAPYLSVTGRSYPEEFVCFNNPYLPL